MTLCAHGCGRRPEERTNPAARSWTASRCEPVNKGVRVVMMVPRNCGRKRHLLVDTLGLVLLVMVTAADVQDRDGARTLLSVLATQFRRLRVIWADGGYAGALPGWVRGLRKWGKVRLEIVRKAKGQRGFAVVPWRWIVERTFAWLGRYRRLKSDYERLPETTEAIIHIAMIRLMVRRLAA